MKNRDKFKEELIKACKDANFHVFFNEHITPAYHCATYGGIGEEKRILLTMLWLDEEYQEPEVDWSKVEVDTPILVSTNGQDWIHRHFAEYRDGRVYAFDGGVTSWTSNISTGWLYAKLAELQKPEHDSCVGCKFERFESDQEPCKDCQHAHMDKYEPQE